MSFVFAAAAFCLIQGIAASSTTTTSVCMVICGNCKGFGVLSNNVCICTVTHPMGVESHKCYAEARTRSAANGMKWQVVRSNVADNSHRRTKYGHPLAPLQQTKRDLLLKRSPRSAPQLTYNSGAFNSATSITPGRRGTAVYQLMIGNSAEDAVQLVFPESDGLEIQHQYVYQSPDGTEYPFARPVGEPSREAGWGRGPSAVAGVVSSTEDDSMSENAPTVYPSRNYPYERSVERSVEASGSYEADRSRWTSTLGSSKKHRSEEDWSVEAPRSWEVRRLHGGSQSIEYSYEDRPSAEDLPTGYDVSREAGYDYATASATASDFTSPPAIPAQV